MASTLLYGQNREGYAPVLDVPHCNIAVIAAEPEATVKLCGISCLERLLRNLQRLGSKCVTIISATPQTIELHLAARSWPRSELALKVRPQNGSEFSARDASEISVDDSGAANAPTLIIDAGIYQDARLLKALMARQETAVLLDSDPPPTLLPLLETHRRHEEWWMCGAAIVAKPGLLGQREDVPLFAALFEAAAAGEVAVIDVNQQPTYLVDLRRDLRPLWFPAPQQPSQRGVAESLLLDAAQNGTLDLPAKVHAPIETWIIARLCKTRITPNQITFCTAIISILVAVLFACGKLPAATLLALAVGVLDGLDGKQARVKVETTKLGKGEHSLDYILELSWWAALAYHFTSTGQLPHAYWWLALLFGSDLIDRLAKVVVKKRTGRNLDDLAPFERFVRLIGGRRNIYIWILGCGLALGAADNGFVSLCWWGAVTAAVHTLRASWILVGPAHAR